MAKKKKQTSIIGLIIVVALLGGGIALAMSHSRGEGAKVEKPPEEFDDEWGKLEKPVPEATVTHILVSWAGKNARATPGEVTRTQDEARKLIEELWLQHVKDPSDANWRKMQTEHNEDKADQHAKFVCKDGAQLDAKFNECGMATKVGHARICESAFGYHLIRREK